MALSLAFAACSDSTIEVPDAVDGAEQEETIEENVQEAGDAVNDGLQNLEQNTEEAAGDAVDGLKNLEQNAEDGLKQGVEEAEKAIEDLKEKMPSSEE